ncbi:1,3-beta-glucanosyltransferase gel4 [Termitomyces sp. T112]|nr:hypothetical protein C0989_000869 [Termitomyces sp. Mn162]KAG5728538.1 1,3-beta-glucanosyltransferase gel4 [Termitomyces sp. T112]KAH0590279.1 hypothetical protein H2248_000442 [Termitomyces sp. 'cryptogamus']KNZ79618.1 1,3-beta-glucanosyltransferase gel4 [Termitomyces sp. J132]
MRFNFRLAALVAVLVSLDSFVQAITQVTRSGRYLYNEDGSRFYIKGIAYQEQGLVVQSADNNFGEPSTFIDPLALPDACSRDLPFLQQLGVNTIRVYSVNSSLNHDACMSTLSNAGIYAIIDLALPLNGSIDRNSPSWSTNLLDQYLMTIDVFNKYDNVLAYNVGNEVVVQNATAVAPFVKAAARDVKAYLKSKSSSILVGYTAINGPSQFRDPLANYLSCDPSNTNSDSTAIDLFGLNDYSWCGNSSFEAAYANTFAEFSGYNVAAYLSEFGCNSDPPRLWTEVDSIFSSQMSPVWSGGVAFSYFPASSAQGQFGMVTISSDGSSVTTSDDFERLKTHYNQASGPNTPPEGSSTSNFPSCPTANSSFLASTTLPPTPNESACNCLLSTLSCRFHPATSNYSAIVGELLDTACSFVGQKGGTCDDIAGNGQTGVYGRLSGCDPTIKLSFVMSDFYQLSDRNPQACNFAGNATINQSAPASASAADAAASSCLSNAAATFVPSAVASTFGSSSTGSSTSSTSTKGNNGAVGLIGNNNALLGMTVMSLVSIASAVWTLA